MIWVKQRSMTARCMGHMDHIRARMAWRSRNRPEPRCGCVQWGGFRGSDSLPILKGLAIPPGVAAVAPATDE